MSFVAKGILERGYVSIILYSLINYSKTVTYNSSNLLFFMILWTNWYHLSGSPVHMGLTGCVWLGAGLELGHSRWPLILQDHSPSSSLA